MASLLAPMPFAIPLDTERRPRVTTGEEMPARFDETGANFASRIAEVRDASRAARALEPTRRGDGGVDEGAVNRNILRAAFPALDSAIAIRRLGAAYRTLLRNDLGRLLAMQRHPLDERVFPAIARLFTSRSGERADAALTRWSVLVDGFTPWFPVLARVAVRQGSFPGRRIDDVVADIEATAARHGYPRPFASTPPFNR